MPLPNPNDDESHDDFMDRCMANPTMNEEYPESDQRYAVCQAQWDKRSESMDDTAERRVIPMDDIELREADNKRTLIGYAARFNKPSEDFGGWRETIKPGAFAEAIKTSDVRSLVNHDPNLLLGRTTSGTLRLKENARGLKFELDLPDTQVGRDTAESIRRGDMSGCSFSFRTAEDVWSEKGEQVMRELIKVDPLFDVGPVTFPAYPQTDVAVRSMGQWRETRGADAPPEPPAAVEETPPEPDGATAIIVDPAGIPEPSETPRLDAAQAELDAADEAERKAAREIIAERLAHN